MTSLAVRSRKPEQMDAADLDLETYAALLSDLAKVNSWTLGRRATIGFLRRASAGMPAFRLMDVGFGHGDMLRRIARWARRRGVAVDLVGVDLNPKSAVVARAATPAGLPIEYRTGDYAAQPTPFDFVISSAVTHHMSDKEIHAFLRYMEERAACGWLVNDIHRHWFAYWGYPLLARIMRWHRIVREDGRLSIARGFRREDWERLVAESGIDTAQVRIVRRFPFRLCVERLR